MNYMELQMDMTKKIIASAELADLETVKEYVLKILKEIEITIELRKNGIGPSELPQIPDIKLLS